MNSFTISISINNSFVFPNSFFNQLSPYISNKSDILMFLFTIGPSQPNRSETQLMVMIFEDKGGKSRKIPRNNCFIRGFFHLPASESRKKSSINILKLTFSIFIMKVANMSLKSKTSIRINKSFRGIGA